MMTRKRTDTRTSVQSSPYSRPREREYCRNVSTLNPEGSAGNIAHQQVSHVVSIGVAVTLQRIPFN
jgi:hypothetical protein